MNTPRIKSREIFASLLLGALTVVGLAAQGKPESEQSTRPQPRRLIVDTDMGLDDVRAIFALLAAENLDLEGVVTTAGSASLGRATDNLVGLLESNECEHVPVVRGVPQGGRAAPPWRSTANSLAGVCFPPPRHLRPRPETAAAFLKHLGVEHPGEVHVLALGPLTNLAAVATEAPDGLARLHTLWIPVTRAGADRICAWNLGWNPEAAEKVLAHAPRIVLVDVGSAGRTRLDAELAGVSGQTPALRWIRKVQEATTGEAAHRFVYDELAAFAVASPEAIRTTDRTYRLTRISPQSGVLAPDDKGNVRVAAFRDPAQPMAWLKRQWQRLPARPATPAHGHDHVLLESFTPETYLRAFHGHLGPYVVLGYRMGRHALALTHSEGHFNIQAHVHCGARPPRSCLIDGIQLGAGCTLGKRNIVVSVDEGPAWVEFTARDDRRVTLRLRPKVPGRIKKLVDERGVEAAGRHFLQAPLDTWLEKRP